MYKFNEDDSIAALRQYVDSTYAGHYSKNKFQSTEFIIDCGHGRGFTIGNLIKYSQRLGNKGDHKEQRKDIMKILHYALILLYIHDTENSHESS